MPCCVQVSAREVEEEEEEEVQVERPASRGLFSFGSKKVGQASLLCAGSSLWALAVGPAVVCCLSKGQ
jgi:hypothetical protein